MRGCGLGHAAHVAEMGLAAVAEPGVDAGEVDGHGGCVSGYYGGVQGRWSGKPVRIRRGPATVTGEAHRTRPRAAATGASARWEGAEGSAREPGDLLRPRSTTRPRGKGWLQMKLKTPTGLIGRHPPSARSRRPPRSRPAEGLRPRRRREEDPAGAHDGRRSPASPSRATRNADRHSAGAAIEQATKGGWDRGSFVTTLLGETHDFSHNDFWAEWIDRGQGYKYGGGVCADQLGGGRPGADARRPGAVRRGLGGRGAAQPQGPAEARRPPARPSPCG